MVDRRLCLGLGIGGDESVETERSRWGLDRERERDRMCQGWANRILTKRIQLPRPRSEMWMKLKMTMWMGKEIGEMGMIYPTCGLCA